jgi:hypothetical protein
VDACERLFELDECPPSLQLSPQDNRPPLQPALLHEAIVFDHPLCACGPVACIGVINQMASPGQRASAVRSE